MPMILWGMTSIMWVMTGLVAQPPATQATPSLDFEFFQTQVQPIFLTPRPGYTRCVVCHSGQGGSTFLQSLAEGATTWTDEESRRNFDRIMRLVTPGQPTQSRLLMHPLEPAAGGDEFHNGGRQFTSQDDPDFRTIAAWVRGGETLGGPGR